MNGKILKIATILLFIAAFIIFFKMAFLNNPNNTIVCFKENCFSVEIAMSQRERTEGLMFRKSLEQDKGMLFVFDKDGEYSFWMKNTLIPLDIIWMNGNKEAVFISRNSQPCNTGDCLSIRPGVEARYVLELNAGTADNIGLLLGEKAVFDLK